MSRLAVQRRILPGFGLSMGYALLYLSLLILLPLSTLFVFSARLGWRGFWSAATRGIVISSYRVSFETSVLAALFDVVFGLLIAWVLSRYRFPGRRLIDALIDLPFALPTAVAGLALTSLYARNGWLGSLGSELTAAINGLLGAAQLSARLGPAVFDWLNLDFAFTPAGIAIALVFIGLPFVVRTVQPVLQDLGSEQEEAAASLGSRRWQTFWRVILPEIWPALLTGFSLSLARGLGEYGSVVFISGNLPFRTEIAPHQIIVELEQGAYGNATAIAVVMLLASLCLLLLVNIVQKLTVHRVG